MKMRSFSFGSAFQYYSPLYDQPARQIIKNNSQNTAHDNNYEEEEKPHLERERESWAWISKACLTLFLYRRFKRSIIIAQSGSLMVNYLGPIEKLST